jgi:hypothetical protein
MHTGSETPLTSPTIAVHDVTVPSITAVSVPLVGDLRASPPRAFYVLGRRETIQADWTTPSRVLHDGIGRCAVGRVHDYYVWHLSVPQRR